MFVGQTKFMTGDVQMAIGTQSRLWGLAAIVGMEEKGVISKGTGRCSTLLFATGVKKLKWHLEHDNLIFLSPLLLPCLKK